MKKKKIKILKKTKQNTMVWRLTFFEETHLFLYGHMMDTQATALVFTDSKGALKIGTPND